MSKASEDSVSPVSDLASLLANARPALSAHRYAIETGDVLPATLESVFAVVNEPEGLTVIREHDAGDWALITMTVMSDLSAVGFTAAFAKALADRDIAANVVAAFHHDHILVPWPKREEAFAALSSLSGEPT
jgi:hypothetical protein